MLLKLLLICSCHVVVFAKPSPQHAKGTITQFHTRPEVSTDELIHIQCLVRYDSANNGNDVTVEIRRNVSKTFQDQHLSINGKVLPQAPEGQTYEASVTESGSDAKEYSFKIKNIHVDSDSGTYQCLVKHQDKVIDAKKSYVEVVEPEAYYYTDDYQDAPDYASSPIRAFTNPHETYSPETSETENSNLDHLDADMESKLKCHEKRKLKSTDVPIASPVVCLPQGISENRVTESPGQSAALPCIAEAKPPAEIAWYKVDESDGLVKINSAFEIVDFGDFFIEVTLKINNLEDKDYGTYVCKATNNNGEEDEMKILLDKPPPATENTLIKSNAAYSFKSSINLLIVCLFLYNYF